MAAGVSVVAVLAGQPYLSTWQLPPALVVLGAVMALVFVPLLPYILSAVPLGDAGAGAAAGYGHAFAVVAARQVALLVGCAALSLIVPRHIASDAYQPTL